MKPSNVLIGLSLLAGPVACSYGDRHYDDQHEIADPAACGAEPRQVGIDTDEALESDPGQGVGVFVEYTAGGRWHLFMTCDSNVSGQPCYFDVVAYSNNGAISNVTREDLESDDEISYKADYVQVVTTTDNDYDGVYLQTEPGDILSVDVYLDGSCYTEYLWWVEGGEVRNGYIGTPLDFTPSEP
ncbi:MAG TPA: hypothetical protein VFQ61_15570 [Polyangiaceae bacterium]|nr:hypothetical protein [Polyangiaceae bacterium]